MAKKNALQEAIAEAKQLRQAAIVNATKQLEENLTPSIKAMLAEKLEKEFDDEDVINEAKTDINGFTEVKPKEVKTEAEEPEKDDEEKDTEEPEAEEPEKGDEEAEEEKPADDEEVDAEEEKAEEPEESDEEPENPEDEEAEELSDDTPLKDITIGDLKSIISQQIAAEAPVPTDPDLDPEVGGVEGQGDEVPAGDLEATTDQDAAAAEGGEEVAPEDPELVNPEAEEIPQKTGEEETEDDDEEIDINEILKELEDDNVNDVMPTNRNGKAHDGGVKGEKPVHQDGEDIKEGQNCPECGKNPCVCDKEDDKKAPKTESCNESKAPKTYKERYETALGVIKVLKETLADANLLNGKLVYANRTLKRSNLSENQKAYILDKLDRVKTIKEAKEIYRTNVQKFTNKKDSLVESHNRQFASKSAGMSTKSTAPVVENDFVRRMQELAGIIE